MEKWNLHRRIAINIVKAIGTNKKNIVLGFMVATAFLSMWISNSATAMMMLPIGVAIILQLSSVSEEEEGFFKGNFGKALMLSIAYSASIGGMATLVGTPTNAVLAAIVKQLYNVEISFAQWMFMALPLVLVLLIICWYYLVNMAFPLKNNKNAQGQEELERQAKSLGRMSWEEKCVLIVFILTAFLWITRSFILDQFFTGLDDSIIAIFGAVILFIIPASSGKGNFILGWEISRELPWGLLLLFGGGLAIASGFKVSGLAEWHYW
jgi:sodium-dependent dicarboxylate transporter 2/3/5